MRSFIRVVVVSHTTVLTQSTWRNDWPLFQRLLAEQPDHLILAGHQVLADPVHLSEGSTLGARKAELGDYAANLWHGYQQLLASRSMQQLLQSAKQVHAIWDDADFAWRGACGGVECEADTAPRKAELVPAGKRLVARGLFHEFLHGLRQRSQSLSLLDVPMLLDLHEHWQGVQEVLELQAGEWCTRLLLSDTCWYRGHAHAFSGTLLGERQRTWLQSALRKPAPHTCLALLSARSLLGARRAWQHWGADYALLRRSVTQPASPAQGRHPMRLLFLAPHHAPGQLSQTLGLCQLDFATLGTRPRRARGYLVLDFGHDGVCVRLCHARRDYDRRYLLTYANWQANEYL